MGAALVLAAGAGVLSAHAAADRAPSTRYLVVRSDLPAGHRLTARDLGSVGGELPQGTTAVPAERADRLVGRTTTVGLRRLDLLRPTDLARRGAEARAGVVVPLDVETARTPGGALRPGAVVTVLSTDPDAVGTVTVAPDAEVVAVAPADESLGSPTTRQVRLRVATPAAAAGLVDASVRSTLTLTVPSDPARGGAR